MSLLLFYGQPSGGGEPSEPVEWSEHTELKCIADGAYSHRMVTAPETVDTTYASGVHKVNANAHEVQIAWGGFGRVGADYPRTIRAGVEHDGIVYPMTFAGSDTTYIGPDGPIWAISDPIPGLRVKAGDTLQVRHLVPVGERSGYYTKDDHHLSGSIPGDRTRGGAVALSPGMKPRTPIGIYGKTKPGASRSVALLGDSFVEEGWARGALTEHGFAWSDTGVWLENVPRDRGAIGNRLPADRDWPYDIALCFHGGNDSSLPTEEMTQLHLNYWALARGAGVPRVYGQTIHAYSTSTDRFATVESQSPQLQRNIHEHNAWVRDGAPCDPMSMVPLAAGDAGVRFGEPGHPADGFFDTHAATAIAPDSYLWKVDGGAWTTDGAHLTPHGSQMLQAELSKWIADNLA